MDLQFKDKNGYSVQLGDVCRFFWNPILNQDSTIFECMQPIVYIPEFAAYGFILESKKGETCPLALSFIANATEYGFEKVNPTIFQ